MIPVQNCVPAAVAEMVRHQPLTPAKLGFCWRIAVGPAMDRASRVRLGRAGEIVVEVPDAHWRREVQRALPTVTSRLAYLLGDDAVARVTIRAPRG